MSLDVSDMLSAVSDWAEEVHGDAVGVIQRNLDDVRPYRDGELAASETLADFGRLHTEIAYTAEHASYTDEGTSPHKIEGNPLLAFDWDGDFVIVHSVNHPGTQGTRWFSDTMTDSTWGDALEEAAARVPFR